MIIGQTAIIEFITPSLATGAAAAPDALPTALLRRNGSVLVAASVTVTNLGTGKYSASVLFDGAHGWAVGDSYCIEATWAMSGTSGIVATLAQGLIESDLAAVLTAIQGAGWSTESLKAIYDAVVARLAAAAYTAPDNAGISTLLSRLTSGRASGLDNLDALISSRLATSGYTAPDNAGIAAIKAKTDQLTFVGSDVKATLDGEEVNVNAGSAQEIWEYPSRTLTSNANVVFVGPVALSGDVEIIRGDSYLAADGRALEWQTTDAATWPALSGASIKFTVRSGVQVICSVAGSVVTATGANKKVRAELPATVTASLETPPNGPARYQFDVQATLGSGSEITLVRGQITIHPDATRGA